MIYNTLVVVLVVWDQAVAVDLEEWDKLEAAVDQWAQEDQ
jgi:hypothetical protein